MDDDDEANGTEIIRPATAAIDGFTTGLAMYLDGLALPSIGLLALPAERLKVLRNLPDLVGALDASQRANAMYLSKFVAACSAGLFDAALNFMWDEVVVL